MAVSTGVRAGKLTRSVTVKTNDRETPQSSLQCVAVVKSALTIEPPTLNFGNVERGTGTLTRTVKIKRGDAGPIHPKLVEEPGQNYEAVLKELTPGEEYELTVSATPPWPNDMLRGNLKIEAGTERATQETVNIFARVMPRVTPVPSRFSVPAERTTEQKLTAQLKWSDNKPGHILSASVDNPKLKVEITEENGGQVIVLYVPADVDLPARQVHKVVVKTDDSEAPTVDIPIYALRPRPAANQPAQRLSAPPLNVEDKKR